MLEIIILAAGRGTRMRSPLPKVLHPLAGVPLLHHVIATARALKPSNIHVVIGHGADEVRATINDDDLSWHLQAEQLGTGHAVAQAMPGCTEGSTALVLFGDVPLLGLDSLKTLVDRADDGIAMLAAELPDPSGYGRVLRDDTGNFKAVVEHKDASLEQLAVREVNTGVLVAPSALLGSLLTRVDNKNAQAEYYLPDALGLAVQDGHRVAVAVTRDPMEILGVNDRLQLEELERTLQVRRAETLMREGVAVSDRRRIDIRGTLSCGESVSIDVNAVFEGDVVLADGVSIGANCVIRNANIGSDTTVAPFCHIEDATLGAACQVGPYARLRPGTELADTVRIGNFVETKKAVFGERSKANHLAYVGDSTIGEDCNVGAGTITCNYDGANKYQTVLGDRVFIGSNTTLVAPVTVESDGFVAAGSVVTKAVGSADLAIGRARQRNVTGWVRPQKSKDT